MLYKRSLQYKRKPHRLSADNHSII